MNKNIIYTITLSGLMLSACMDSFDAPNPNAPTFEDQIENLKSTQSLLTTVYNAMFNHNVLSIEEMTICSDMGYPGYGRSGNPQNETLAAYYNQTYTKSYSGVSNKWSALYTGIFRANQTIEALNLLAERGQVKNEEWTEQMAQARFFRGLFHFYLHSVFNNGEVIIFDSVPKNDNDFHKPVSPADEVQEFFREDLKYAYENLPENYGSKSEKVTKGTTATILGTSYLYSEDFEKAIVYFNDVINNDEYGYELVDDMSLMFTSAGEFNKESIFEINYQLGVHPEMNAYDENAPTNRLGYTSSSQSFTLPCWITHLYQTEKMNPNDERNRIHYIDENGEEKDSLRSISLRASAMIAVVQDDNTPYYLSPYTSVKVPVNEKTAVGYYRKYSNWDIIDDEKNLPDGERKSGKNVIVNRLADVYLMYAECMLRKDNPDVEEALKYMNLIRDRWALELLGTPGQNPSFSPMKAYDGKLYNAETLFKQLQDVDRPLEMSAEGNALRFIDLRRWGIAKQRYTELSKEVYHLEPRNVPESTKPRYKVWLKYGPSPEGELYPELQDYILAAQNYDETRNGYWPIPLLEEQNNPNLYKK